MAYAIISDGKCVNIIEADTAYAAWIGAVELPEGCGIGDNFNGTEWSKADVPAEDPPVDRVAALEGRVATLLEDLAAVQAELATLKGE